MCIFSSINTNDAVFNSGARRYGDCGFDRVSFLLCWHNFRSTNVMAPQYASNHRKYGVPIYGASWLLSNVIFNVETRQKLGDADCDGATGIRYALLVAHFDSAANSLSDKPVSRLETGDELPYRFFVHPEGERVICSMPNSCRWYEWDLVINADNRKVGLNSSENQLPQLEGVGQQLAISFNKEGSILALGDENGHLRAFRWPSMEIIIDEPKAYSSIKDSDFSVGRSLLVSSGGGGPCRIWNLASSSIVASLSRKVMRSLASADFLIPVKESGSIPYCEVRYTTQQLEQWILPCKGGSIVTWDTKSWKRKWSKHIFREPISALSVSPDGSLIAMDLMSASMDSSAWVTVITETKNNGIQILNNWKSRFCRQDAAVN